MPIKLAPKIVEAVEHALGGIIKSTAPVSGGDICEAFKLETSTGRFFLKLNSKQAAPAMFEAEAEGLNALRTAFKGMVPKVVAQGTAESEAFLVLEYLQAAPPSNKNLEEFGVALAQMHRQSHQAFGWHQDNFIGTIAQQNKWCANWNEFMATQRFMPLVKALADEGSFAKSDYKNAELLCKQLPHLIPEELPSLLHGDLWSGNYLITQSGAAAIFDPAVYYGHREMDLAMARLFGGFGEAFFAAYKNNWPLQPGWEERVPLMQLYPLLVHAVLFGGHYVSRCREVVKDYC